MANPKVSPRVVVPISVSLANDKLAKLAPTSSAVPVADVLAARCSQYLEQAADGGLMLSPDQVSTIEQNLAKPVTTGADVVKATMAKAGRSEDGQLSFTINLDPSWKPLLEERAVEGSRPIDQLFREMFEMALENNWIGGYIPPGSRHTITAPAEAFFAKRIDGSLSIDKIVAYIKSIEKSREQVPA